MKKIVQRIQLTGAQLAGLVLTLGLLTVASAQPVITNPSFEADTFTVFPGYVSGNAQITGWTGNADNRVGLNPSEGSPFADNGTVPAGSQIAFIQSDAGVGGGVTLSTFIDGLTVGQDYKVTFRVNARSGNTPNLKVDIDGGRIIDTAVTPVGGSAPYKYFAFDFTAAAASQTLTLINDATGDNTVVIDDFSIATKNSGWSYAAWSDDATSGIDGSKSYTHAYNFGSSASANINGITFTGVAGGNPAVPGAFSTTGFPNVFNNDANNLGEGSRQLANDFLYNGAVQTITINGLIPGGEYLATIYSVGWEDGTRAATFSVGDDRLTVNQDHFGNNNGIRISHQYTATTSSITLTIVPLQGNTFHAYGFANQVVELPPNTPPAITQQPQDQVAGIGESVTFTGAASGTPPVSFQWFFQENELFGEESPTLTLSSVTTDQAGSYYFIVTDAQGSATSAVAVLTVRALVPGLFSTGVDDNKAALADGAGDPHYILVVNADGAPINALVHSSTIFPIVNGPWVANDAQSKWISPRVDSSAAAGLAQGNGTYVYRTEFDLTGLDTAAVTITGSWAVDNTGVAIRVNGTSTGIVNNNGFGGLTSFTINSVNATFVDGINSLEFEVQNVDATAGYTGLRVANLRGLAPLPGTPPSITVQPQDVIAQIGEFPTFTVVAEGSAPLSYQWLSNGVPVAEINSPVLTATVASTNDAAGYSVIVSNPSGSVTSRVATVTVFTPIPGLFNTGVDDLGAPLADNAVDPHYRLVTNAHDSTSSDAIVEDSTVFPIVGGPWVPNSARSKWIGPLFNTSAGAVGIYVYRLTFNITDRDPATVRIVGQWATDNPGPDIRVNGVSTGNPESGGFTAYTPFAIASSNATFVTGENTIDFVVENIQAIGYTGLRVENLKSDAQPASAVALNLSIALQNGNVPAIGIQGAAGRPVTVEFKNSLTTGTVWQPLTNFTLTTGSAVVVDAAAPGSSPRFYRAVQ